MADLSAESNDLHVVQDPVILRKFFHQIVFHFFRIAFFRKPQPSGDPLYMGVDNDTRDIVYISADHIGRLPADSRQFREFLYFRGNLSAVLFADQLRTGNDIFRLAVIKPR